MLTPAQRSWVDALRSGKYQQTDGVLTRVLADRSEAHCCLGVACELAVEAGIIPEGIRPEYYGPVAYDDGGEGGGGEPMTALIVNPKVREFFGLRTDDGQIGNYSNLTELNDDGASFAEIADTIEAHASELFFP